MSTHLLADADYDGFWYAYEGGATIGERGSENGYVLCDEELGDPDDPEAADARVTLEQGDVEKPGYFYSIILHPWLFHVHRQEPADGEARAREIFEAIKVRLIDLARLLPYEEDGAKGIEAKMSALKEAIVDFERDYPSVSPAGL